MPYYQPRTPILYDIAAIQWLYGKNPTTGQGNTIYQWQQGEIFIEAIYDVSGIDTIDAHNQRQSVVINLGQGRFSSIGGSRSQLAIDNVVIAFGVKIENAIGGVGNDILVGNHLPNNLLGSSGADVLSGQGRNDVLIGGAGNDTLIGGIGNDVLTGGVGKDIFTFQSRRDGIDRITDFLRGNDLIDVRSLLREVSYPGTNPFRDRFLRAFTRQGSTVLVFDEDGSRGNAAARPLAILENFTDLQRLRVAINSLL